MISKKTQYGLKALSYMAKREKMGPILIADISLDQKIPIKFLEAILLDLKKPASLRVKKEKVVAIILPYLPAK